MFGRVYTLKACVWSGNMCKRDWSQSASKSKIIQDQVSALKVVPENVMTEFEKKNFIVIQWIFIDVPMSVIRVSLV